MAAKFRQPLGASLLVHLMASTITGNAEEPGCMLHQHVHKRGAKDTAYTISSRLAVSMVISARTARLGMGDAGMTPLPCSIMCSDPAYVRLGAWTYFGKGIVVRHGCSEAPHVCHCI